MAFLKTISFIFLCFVTWCLGRIVFYNDYSTMAIDPIANPEVEKMEVSPRAGVHLLSYAQGKAIFFQNQQALAASALNRGIDFIHNYRKSHLDPEFVAKNKAILQEKIGGGFWLWKPWIIAQTLKQVPENDLVIYADSGLVFQSSITPMLEAMGDKDVMLVAYNPLEDGYPIEVTKRDVFVRLKCDEPRCWEGQHLWAAFLAVKNTPQARAFIEEWLELCQEDQLLMNTPSISPAHRRQKKHHHDESILSALYNARALKGDTFFKIMPVAEFRKTLFWHHRHPGKESVSILHKSSYFSMRGIERDWVLNAPWMKKLREYLLGKTGS
jgi:hypothetical protein